MTTTTDSLTRKREQVIEMISDVSEGRYAAGWMGGIEQQLAEEAGIWDDIYAVTGTPQGYRAENGWTEPRSTSELRDFIEGRLQGYETFLAHNKPTGDKAQATHYGEVAVMADTLTRLLTDFDSK